LGLIHHSTSIWHHQHLILEISLQYPKPGNQVTISDAI